MDYFMDAPLFYSHSRVHAAAVRKQAGWPKQIPLRSLWTIQMFLGLNPKKNFRSFETLGFETTKQIKKLKQNY